MQELPRRRKIALMLDLLHVIDWVIQVTQCPGGPGGDTTVTVCF